MVRPGLGGLCALSCSMHAPGSKGCSTCVACRGITRDLDKGGQQPYPGAGSQKQYSEASRNDLYGHEELWDNELIQLAPTLQVWDAHY